MLGLRHACSYQEVAMKDNKAVIIIHPDKYFELEQPQLL